jgi:hypothetical protein
MKVFAVLLLFVCLAQPVRAEDKVYGLLELGALCWWECEGHDQAVFLYKERSQYAAPALILKREMLFPVPDQDNRESPYWPDHEEYDYEEKGAVVYEVIDDWYKIKIKNEYLWLYKNQAGTFHAYPQILRDRLTYLPDWDFLLWDRQGGTARSIPPPYAPPNWPEDGNEVAVNVLSIKKTDREWWIEVEILDNSACTSGGEPKTLATGWLPAYTQDNKRTIWFYSRGC